VAKVGGLLHIMLPDSRIDANKARTQGAMFVDTGVPALFRAAYQLGAQKHRVQICVAGGAQIMDNSGYFNIGKRNHEALTKLLGEHQLTIHAEQVGGMVNRTMYVNLATGNVRLKISGQPQEVFLCKN
jgi:chemotaxis protein CheD